MSDPAAPSVNSWLEDELYHQYLYDRQTVDSGWKQVFDADSERLNPNGVLDTPPEMRALPAPAAGGPDNKTPRPSRDDRGVSSLSLRSRSEERRVGKEGRSRWSPYH